MLSKKVGICGRVVILSIQRWYDVVAVVSNSILITGLESLMQVAIGVVHEFYS